MSRSATVTWGVAALLFAVGLSAGGWTGARRVDAVRSDRAVCITCHHDTPDPARLDRPPPSHASAFKAKCHSCHVLPVREMLAFIEGEISGRQERAWSAPFDNPILGGQTCLECHLGHGRSNIQCERCHVRGDVAPVITGRCEVCHTSEPYEPHASMACRNCHPGAYIDQEAMRHDLMIDKHLLGTRREQEEEER